MYKYTYVYIYIYVCVQGAATRKLLQKVRSSRSRMWVRAWIACAEAVRADGYQSVRLGPCVPGRSLAEELMMAFWLARDSHIYIYIYIHRYTHIYIYMYRYLNRSIYALQHHLNAFAQITVAIAWTIRSTYIDVISSCGGIISRCNVTMWNTQQVGSIVQIAISRFEIQSQGWKVWSQGSNLW
jgi:hypothetical protein